MSKTLGLIEADHPTQQFHIFMMSENYVDETSQVWIVSSNEFKHFKINFENLGRT